MAKISRMVKNRKPWVFTEARKRSLKKAQREHVRLVELGKKVRGR